MSGQGASGSNLPVIALIIVGAVFLIGFYYADRTSSPNQEMAVAASTPMQQAESAEMKAKIAKHKQAMASDTSDGFSGSLEAYLTHAEQVQTAKELSSKGFSGSGSEYLGSGAKVGKSVNQINGVTATGQSMDEYMASAKPGSSSSPATPAKSSSPSSSTNSAPQASSSNGESFSGSMDEYMDKFGG